MNKSVPDKPRIEIYACDDWVRVYLDGKQIINGHEAPIDEVLVALGITYVSTFFDDSALGEYGDDFEGAVARARA